MERWIEEAKDCGALVNNHYLIIGGEEITDIKEWEQYKNEHMRTKNPLTVYPYTNYAGVTFDNKQEEENWNKKEDDWMNGHYGRM